MLNAENELKKWAPVLEHADAPAITDSYKKAVTAKLLENTEKAIQEEKAHSSFSLNEGQTQTGAVDTFDPVLISLVRRAMPNLIAYDVAGVQPMSGPTGLIFAMKARIGDGTPIVNTDAEAFGTTAPDTGFSGSDNNSPAVVEAGDDAASLFDSPAGTVTTGTGIDTAFAEIASNSVAGNKFGEMGFSIDKSTVTAKTR